ncbi:MAG: pentapeptide repeat-containing protein [Nitrosopumilus sp.]|nr:pentapeptide repeat-containing protein [Nitrosopumilus sp.]
MHVQNLQNVRTQFIYQSQNFSDANLADANLADANLKDATIKDVDQFVTKTIRCIGQSFCN